MRPFNFPALRVALYVALAMFSIVLLALSADRLHYTLTLKRSDPLNQGRPFYDHIIAELIFTTSVTILWSFYMIALITSPLERIPFFRSLLFMYEFTGLFVLWVFWLVGAAISSHLWGDLSWCWSYIQCRTLSALVAFAWTGWATLTILGTSSIAFVIAKKATRHPAHGRYFDDDGEFRGQTRQPDMRFLPNFNRSG